MRGIGRGSAQRSINRASAEADKQRYYGELENIRGEWRHVRAEQHQQCTSRDQRERVAQSPARTEPCSLGAASLAGHQGRYGRKMIRLQRVPNTEQRAEGRGREQTYSRHRGQLLEPSQVRVPGDPVNHNGGQQSRQNPARVRLRKRSPELDGVSV